jgi:hypothetical protein
MERYKIMRKPGIVLRTVLEEPSGRVEALEAANLSWCLLKSSCRALKASVVRRSGYGLARY